MSSGTSGSRINAPVFNRSGITPAHTGAHILVFIVRWAHGNFRRCAFDLYLITPVIKISFVRGADFRCAPALHAH